MLAVAVLLGISAAVPVPRASAADAGQFDPGYLISDQVFYDSGAISEAEIQRFLNAQVPTCRATSGPTCLRSYTQTTPSKAAVANRCGAYAGGSGQTAARILYGVGRACGINPKVLIVLLQKEQSLVTSTAPTSTQYRSATGYGCPDTAACDSTYYGFFNQVYMAALQFKRYAGSPGDWAYQAGRDNAILYHPNAACGRKTVFIRNQATAGLYIYTPYTPNAAALANLYGTGDSCSSYGNRNFWRMFTDWFGSTRGDDSPTGRITGAAGGYRAIRVAGWVNDPNSADPIRAHVYVDGKGAASVAADGPSDGHGSSGFTAVVGGIAPGTHEVCVYGINVGPGGNRKVDCTKVVVPSGSPFGSLDSARDAGPGAITVNGWAIDPDVTASIRVHLYVDGVGKASVAAGGARADVGRAYPGFGNAHGFTATLTGLAPGDHRICAFGINVEGGKNVQLGCRTAAPPTGSPRGGIATATAPTVGVVEVAGWAYDPDVAAPIRAHVYVDGVGTASVAADGAAPAGASIPAGYGTRHGFATTLRGLSPGSHEVCVWGINTGPGANARLACTRVAMPSGSPTGVLDQAGGGPAAGTAFARGWAFDPDTVDPIRVHVYLDGVGARADDADLPRPDLVPIFPGIGSRHGFDIAVPGVAPGAHELCAYAINRAGPGGNVLLGCWGITVP